MTASADLAIRMARAAFNRALAEANLKAIEPLLARDVVLVTGTDSAVLMGKRAQLATWKRHEDRRKARVKALTAEPLPAKRKARAKA